MTTIALYKAGGSEGKWQPIDEAINLLSPPRRGYSHAELIIDDLWYSSTMRDEGVDFNGNPKKDGTRAKRIDPDVEKWTFIHLPNVTEHDEGKMLAWFNTRWIMDARYDFGGVLRFVLPWEKEHPSKFFCSELVVSMLRAGGHAVCLEPAYKVSPNRLAEVYGVHA